MTPETCIVCGTAIVITDPWDVTRKASWGPVTLYYHPGCEDPYKHIIAPRLRDAVIRTVRRWKQRLAP